jgi:glycosyltransferase involved in cell wall biosynthesis
VRVLVVATWFPGPHNPAEAPFIVDHIRALQNIGHQVRVVHVQLRIKPADASRTDMNGATPETWDGIDVVRTWASPRRPSQTAASVRAIIRQLHSADVLHTMAFSSILVAVIPWLVRRPGRGKAWVHTEHWTGALNPASVSRLWQRIAWIRRVYAFPHQITGVGDALAAAIVPYARRGAVSVVPCVVRSPMAVWDAEFGEPLRLVAVGAVISRKRPMAVIDTVRWLRGQGLEVELTWVGDGPLRPDCELAVRATGLEGAVHFVGSVGPQEVNRFLAGADLFLLPSEHETFFASAAEAIGAGRAVVISRLDGLGSFLNEGNSVVVEGADPEVLGRAVIEARTQFRTVSAESIAAPIRAAYSVEAVGKLFQAVYFKAGASARPVPTGEVSATGGAGDADIMDR